MRIEELEAILAKHPYLPKPRYVYMVEERVIAEYGDLSLIVKGAAPKCRRDTIVLTPDAGHDTVVHEILHTMGFGELGASVLGKRIASLREVLPPALPMEVRYKYAGSPHPKVKVYERVE